MRREIKFYIILTLFIFLIILELTFYIAPYFYPVFLWIYNIGERFVSFIGGIFNDLGII